MDNENDPKKILRTQIYDKYLECIVSLNENNMILVYNLVVKWCRKYSFKKQIIDVAGEPCIQADELGVDIYDVLDTWIKSKKSFKNKSHFFGCLWVTLKNKLNENYRNCPRGLKISKNKLEIWNNFEKLRVEKEGILERKLDRTECEELMSELMAGKRKKIKDYFKEYEEYFSRKDTIPFSALFVPDKDGNESDESIHDPRIIDPSDEYSKNEEIRIIRDAVREILKSENSQCLNDILTAKYKGSHIDLFCLSEFKNKDIVDNYEKTGKVPASKEIYLKYYDVTPGSAEKLASDMFTNFKKMLSEKVRNHINPV